jgi:hypothetical protein
MRFDWRNFGMATMAVALGMGCSSVTNAPAGQGEGGGGSYALAQVPVLTPIESALTKSDNFFITQYHHVRYNPVQGTTNNANCGPTSLAMALKAFGKEPADLASPSRAHDLILYVRREMTGTSDENTWTYPVQVLEGAKRLGLQGEMVFSLGAIERALNLPGRVVVVNVNPSPAYADRLVYPYNGGHFALLTGVQGNRAFLNDPLANGPMVISTAQLGTALTTPLGSDPNGRYVPPFDGGIVLWR